MIPNQKHLFNIPDEIRYLNCAFLSPQLKSVSNAGHESVANKESPWKLTPQDFFVQSEKARGMFAELLDATADDISIIPAVSYGVSIAAKNIKVSTGENIVVLEDQFPSNIYPWRHLEREKGAVVNTVLRPKDEDWTSALLNNINENTAIVALPHCHWTDGSLINLVKIGNRCREINAALVVDATQSLGAFPLSVKEISPDFVIAATYKWLLGPYSLGFMYINPSYHGGQPLEHNWINRKNSEDFTGLVNYREEFQKGARRFDVGGRSNFVLMPMVIAALKQILSWHVPQIAATLSVITEQIANRANKVGLNVMPADLRASHLIGLRFPQGAPDGLIEQLSKENIFVSMRGNCMRISPHLYNTEEDIERLFEVLETNLFPK